VGYAGDACDECAEGFFKNGPLCHQCYCTGKTKACLASAEHFFWNVTLENPYDHELTFRLARRTPYGGLEPLGPLNIDGKPMLERLKIYRLGDMERPEESVVIRQPPLDRGVFNLMVQIQPDSGKEASDENEPSIPIYVSKDT
ncbi:unnamed protein product, partial [Protopolystoma xenopodis]